MASFIRCTCLLAGLALVGCSDKLETGYKPRKLGDTEATRKSYYASPYSENALAEDSVVNRPTHRRPQE